MLCTLGVYKIKKNTYSGEVHIVVGGINCIREYRYRLLLKLASCVYNINISVYRHLKQSIPTISELKKLVEKIK